MHACMYCCDGSQTCTRPPACDIACRTRGHTTRETLDVWKKVGTNLRNARFPSWQNLMTNVHMWQHTHWQSQSCSWGSIWLLSLTGWPAWKLKDSGLDFRRNPWYSELQTSFGSETILLPTAEHVTYKLAVLKHCFMTAPLQSEQQINLPTVQKQMLDVESSIGVLK